MWRTVEDMEIDWTHELVDQLEFHWSRDFRPRLDGLTDEQYLWEPAPGMWSVRRETRPGLAGAPAAPSSTSRCQSRNRRR